MPGNVEGLCVWPSRPIPRRGKRRRGVVLALSPPSSSQPPRPSCDAAPPYSHLLGPPALGGLAGRPSRWPARAFRGAVFEWLRGRGACEGGRERGREGGGSSSLVCLVSSAPLSFAHVSNALLTRRRGAGAGAPPAAPRRSSPSIEKRRVSRSGFGADFLFCLQSCPSIFSSLRVSVCACCCGG
jgi:hypothetical protein